MCTAYLMHGIVPDGENARRLMMMVQRLLGTGQPFCIAADWNMTTSDIAASGFQTIMVAVPVVPDVPHTCWSKMIIDCCTVSADLPLQ